MYQGLFRVKMGLCLGKNMFLNCHFCFKIDIKWVSKIWIFIKFLKLNKNIFFRVTAEDNKDSPIQKDSSSACWKHIAETALYLQRGSKKVSVSGPDMFGL